MAKKKKKEVIPFGTYYSQGELTKKEMKMICDLLKSGVKVYHQFGKPSGGGCPPGGCH